REDQRRARRRTRRAGGERAASRATRSGSNGSLPALLCTPLSEWRAERRAARSVPRGGGGCAPQARGGAGVRILAIRGANLASLAGKFELNLAEGPLAQAGVFAICGPTGAGKSTLLDAMCLALFDDAPRLDASSRVRVGREEDVDDRL